MLINIISNAIKFTSSGHVKVNISYEPNHDSIPKELRFRAPIQYWLDSGVTNIKNFSQLNTEGTVLDESLFSD